MERRLEQKNGIPKDLDLNDEEAMDYWVASRLLKRPILVIFEICHFLVIPWLFEYFSENGWSQKIAFYSETDGPHLDIQI